METNKNFFLRLVDETNKIFRKVISINFAKTIKIKNGNRLKILAKKNIKKPLSLILLLFINLDVNINFVVEKFVKQIQTQMQLNEETIESPKNLFNKLEEKTAPKTGASISKKRSEFALERVYEMEIFLLSLLIHKNRPYNYCFIGSCLASIVLQKTNQLVRQRPNAAMLGSQRIKLSPRSLLNFNIIYNGWAAQKRVELIGEPSDQIDSFERVLEPVEAEKTEKTHGNSAAFHEVKGKRNEFKCKICKKKLSSKSSLNLHRRVHTGETPHRCPYCNEMFRWYTSFKRHMKVHNKDMVCPVYGCGEKFKTKSEVDEHCENIHIANISQPEESRE